MIGSSICRSYDCCNSGWLPAMSEVGSHFVNVKKKSKREFDVDMMCRKIRSTFKISSISKFNYCCPRFVLSVKILSRALLVCVPKRLIDFNFRL